MAKEKVSEESESTPLTAVYAGLGVGQIVIEKVSKLSGKAIDLARSTPEDRKKAADKVYHDLAARGEKLVSTIRGSEYTKAVAGQAQVVGQQVRSATSKGVSATAKGVQKAADTTAKAAKAATDRVS